MCKLQARYILQIITFFLHVVFLFRNSNVLHNQSDKKVELKQEKER